MATFYTYVKLTNLSVNYRDLLYFKFKKSYTVFSKVDSARKVSRLGKSVNERAHLLCGATV